MTSRIEAVWNAEIVATRGLVDDPMCLSVSASCVITNEGGPAETSPQLMHDNAVNWIAEQTGLDVDGMNVVALHWSEMPYTRDDQ